MGESVAMEPSSSTGGFSPTARCAGGPLPRPAFRSFLATAGDPSPNFGGGVVWAGLSR
jgi:hypothetical protein